MYLLETGRQRGVQFESAHVTGLEGTYMIGALSSYGMMFACGEGELLAAQVAGRELLSYARAYEL